MTLGHTSSSQVQLTALQTDQLTQPQQSEQMEPYFSNEPLPNTSSILDQISTQQQPQQQQLQQSQQHQLQPAQQPTQLPQRGRPTQRRQKGLTSYAKKDVAGPKMVFELQGISSRQLYTSSIVGSKGSSSGAVRAGASGGAKVGSNVGSRAVAASGSASAATSVSRTNAIGGIGAVGSDIGEYYATCYNDSD